MTKKSITSGMLFFCDVDISIAILNITSRSRDARATHLAILPSQGMGMKSTQRWILAFCLYFPYSANNYCLSLSGHSPCQNLSNSLL
jgi:hypothetical protein